VLIIGMIFSLARNGLGLLNCWIIMVTSHALLANVTY
jgi:hypothetical protein